MTERFNDALNNFLIIMIAMAIILLLVLFLGARRSSFRDWISEKTHQDFNQSNKKKKKKKKILEFNREYYITGEKTMRKPLSGKKLSRPVSAVLVQKIDERRRTVDSEGNKKLYNEYYELIFRMSNGNIRHLVTSKRIYLDIPFHEQGMLVYKGDTFVSFQYRGGVIREDPPRNRATMQQRQPQRQSQRR